MTVVGTYGYMPMEQFGGKTVPASDLYSLGATLIYTIAGVHPADLSQDDGTIQLPANNLSKSWQRWVETLTEANLKKRFPDVITAKLALARLGESDSIVREKPYGSKIVLAKKLDTISIEIPDRRSPFERVFSTIHNMIMVTFISMVMVSVITALFGLYPAVVVFNLLILAQVIYNFFYYLYHKSYLTIDNDRIGFYETIGKFRFSNQTSASPRSQVDRLTYNLRPYIKGYNRTPLFAKEIVIFAGVREYRIYTNSDAECEWLLAELSEWLDLPVSK